MRRRKEPVHGIALIAVLWLVAALSLITAGIVQSVRADIQVVGLQRQSATANALADAAILLALQNLHALQQEARKAVDAVPVEFEGVPYLVQVRSLNGLLDINNAPVGLLNDLYRYVGGLDAQNAQAMAQATLETRQRKARSGAAQGFFAIEDLMEVPHMNFDLYARLSPFVTADLKEGSGRLNPLATPADLLAVLTGGDLARANDLAAKRDSNPNHMDTSFFKSEYTDMTSSRGVRMQVDASLPDGRAVRRAWNVYWGADPRSRLPWRVLSISSVVLSSAATGP